jgi:hypothetical protein
MFSDFIRISSLGSIFANSDFRCADKKREEFLIAKIG